MADLHYPDDEPSCTPVSAFDFDFDLYSFSTNDYKDLIYEEIMLYHDEETAALYLENKEKYPNGVLFKKYGKE